MKLDFRQLKDGLNWNRPKTVQSFYLRYSVEPNVVAGRLHIAQGKQGASTTKPLKTCNEKLHGSLLATFYAGFQFVLWLLSASMVSFK